MRRFDPARRLMLCDSHCHLSMLDERGVSTEDLFSIRLKNSFSHLMDIGIDCDDLPGRIKFRDLAAKNSICLKFSAGVFPSKDSILHRKDCIQQLGKNIDFFKGTTGEAVAAVGECGIDHHWNDESLFRDERDLFADQLDIANGLSLPVIVHSRDGFKDTLDVIASVKSSQKKRGVIHCFSYGIDEARAFLDEGFMISFSGAITYGGKAKNAASSRLCNFIPEDMLLLETDSPFLAPQKFRGRVNSPDLIGEIYKFVASARGIPLDQLEEVVIKNFKSLFCK